MPNARFSSEKVNPTAQITRAICKIVDRSGPTQKINTGATKNKIQNQKLKLSFRVMGNSAKNMNMAKNDLEHA